LVNPHFGIRTNQYTLIRFYGKLNYWELYDVKKDPSELKNLAELKEYGPVMADLKKKLNAATLEYKDEEAEQIIKNL
jgi:arylsulfatase A-like enzyme